MNYCSILFVFVVASSSNAGETQILLKDQRVWSVAECGEILAKTLSVLKSRLAVSAKYYLLDFLVDRIKGNITICEMLPNKLLQVWKAFTIAIFFNFWRRRRVVCLFGIKMMTQQWISLLPVQTFGVTFLEYPRRVALIQNVSWVTVSLQYILPCYACWICITYH